MVAERQTTRVNNVNIDELEFLIARKLAYYRSTHEDNYQKRKLCMIFRVPKHTKQVDKLSYQPMVLSVGPYFHGNSSLVFMDNVQWNCLDYVLKLNCRQKLEVYLTVMEDLEKVARSPYSDEIPLESDMFLRMLLLDGCFILVYLNGTVDLDGCAKEDNSSTIFQYVGRNTESISSGVGPSNLDPVQGEELNQTSPNQPLCHPIFMWHHSHVFRDLLLLENQLPFFIVRKIYELLSGDESQDQLTGKFCKYLEQNIHMYTAVTPDVDGQKDFYHLLQLCHMYFRPRQRTQQKQNCKFKYRWLDPLAILRCKYFKLSYGEDAPSNQQKNCANFCPAVHRWHRAEQYHEAGIEFKKKEYNEHNPHSLLYIIFDKGEIIIPCLPIDDNTACLFRNLVAFEQTCPLFGNDFTAYIVFITQLISMPSDVALLARKGIILHHMRSDDEVSSLFSKLGKNVDFDTNGIWFLVLSTRCHLTYEYIRWGCALEPFLLKLATSWRMSLQKVKVFSLLKDASWLLSQEFEEFDLFSSATL
uniref:Uncharacterized protein n=1 Tax=Oryza brachyantha TaxID=4533 RepID=J3L0J6_ORYBR